MQEILKRNQFKPFMVSDVYTYKPNFLLMVVEHNNEFYFRAYGRTISIFSTEEELQKLIKTYNDKND